jgi:hypothetical protein
MCAKTAVAPPLGTAAEALDGWAATFVTEKASATTATRDRLLEVFICARSLAEPKIQYAL